MKFNSGVLIRTETESVFEDVLRRYRFPSWKAKRISQRFQVYTSYRVTMRFGLRLTADKKRRKGIQFEENAFVTRERRILESRDCEQTRVKQGPFDTPLQSRLSRTCRHPIYIYTYLPVSIGV